MYQVKTLEWKKRKWGLRRDDQEDDAGHLLGPLGELVRTHASPLAPRSPSPNSQALCFPVQELVRILHKALEAAQQEKRATSAYLAAAEDKDRLELVRHKVRQIAELGRRVEALEQERESLAQTASLREQQVQELQQHVQLLMDKNQAKQQVICKLSEKVTQDFMHLPKPLLVPPDTADRDFLSQQEKMEHLKVGPCPPGPAITLTAGMFVFE